MTILRSSVDEPRPFPIIRRDAATRREAPGYADIQLTDRGRVLGPETELTAEGAKALLKLSGTKDRERDDSLESRRARKPRLTDGVSRPSLSKDFTGQISQVP